MEVLTRYMMVVDNGQLRKARHVKFADEVFKLKNTTGVWGVIDFIVAQWIGANPTRYDSFVMEVGIKRDTRSNALASNKSKTLRSTLDVPQDIIKMIRTVYKADELPMDKNFFEEIWKRYPAFRIADRL